MFKSLRNGRNRWTASRRSFLVSTIGATIPGNAIFAKCAEGDDYLFSLLFAMRRNAATGEHSSPPRVAPTFEVYGDYIDLESATVMRPTGEKWTDNPFADGCWRSAWFYASLFVLRRFDPATYIKVADRHRVSVSDGERFLIHFADHCTSDNGFSLWKYDEPYSRDQLCPLLYLLACVERYHGSEQAIAAGREIVKHLSEHERHGRPLSSEPKGNVSRGIGFLIEELCGAYGVVYRFQSYPSFVALAYPEAARRTIINAGIRAENLKRQALGLEKKGFLEDDADKIARRWHRDYTRVCFELGLLAFSSLAKFEGTGKKEITIAGKQFPTGLDAAIDGYSAFNALAQLSMLLVLKGSIDNDIRRWRRDLWNPAMEDWGPAFKIVRGKNIERGVLDQYYTMQVHRDQDNDILLAQRPKKFIDGTYPTNNEASSNSRLVLDFVVLSALEGLWRG